MVKNIQLIYLPFLTNLQISCSYSFRCFIFNVMNRMVWFKSTCVLIALISCIFSLFLLNASVFYWFFFPFVILFTYTCYLSNYTSCFSLGSSHSDFTRGFSTHLELVSWSLNSIMSLIVVWEICIRYNCLFPPFIFAIVAKHFISNPGGTIL